jgi:adenylate kinase
MGYLDDEIKRLQGIVSNLEERVKALEGRQLGGGQKKTAEEIRMILIGPPGAGTCRLAVQNTAGASNRHRVTGG